MQREKVTDQTDVAQLVRLDFGPEGKETTSSLDGSPQWQYTLDNNQRIMWLPRSGRDAILKSGAQTGDAIEIIKVQRGTNTQYLATLVSDRDETQPTAARPQSTRPIMPARAYYQPEAAAASPLLTSGNGPIQNGGTALPRPLTLSPIAQQLAGTLCAAVDAAAQAEAYARGKGLSIQFTADDIRAIGLSIYIGVTRQQGVR